VCLLRGTFYILRSAHTLYLCVLCGSENKHPGISHNIGQGEVKVIPVLD
jgi:hypothetical protein